MKKLTGNQSKLDLNKNGKLDSNDFKMLRKKKGNGGGTGVSSQTGFAQGTNADLLMNQDYLAYKKGGGVNNEEINLLLNGYFSAVLFAETDLDTEESLDANYSMSDFDKETVESTKKMLSTFYSKNKKAIKDSGLDLDTIGMDIWYTRAGHGAGFFDHSLDNDIEEKLTKGAKALGEYPTVETYDGKISISGGRVFKANGGGLANVPESFPSTDAMSYKLGGVNAKDYYEKLAVYVQGVGSIYNGASMKKAIDKANSYLKNNPKAEIVISDEKFGDTYDSNGNMIEEMAKGGSTSGWCYSIGGL